MVFAAGCATDVDVEDQRTNSNISANEDGDDDPTTPDNSNRYEFRAENFVDTFQNPYFNVTPGRKYFLDGKTLDGKKVHVELLGTDKTKEIQGVTARALWERKWLDDSLVTDKKSWYAEDKGGNVWLLGEDELNIFGGYLRSEEGNSWQAGQKNARAGIFIPGEPREGIQFNREFDGANEYRSEVLKVGEDYAAPGGDFKDCLRIRTVTNGQKNEDHSLYCKEIGNLAGEIIPNTFAGTRLSKIENNFSTSGIDIKYPQFSHKITEDKAREIALAEVEGGISANSVELDLVKDEPAFKVEVKKDNGNSKFVWIDVNNGDVLKAQ